MPLNPNKSIRTEITILVIHHPQNTLEDTCAIPHVAAAITTSAPLYRRQ